MDGSLGASGQPGLLDEFQVHERSSLQKQGWGSVQGGSQCFQRGPVLGRTSWELLRPWELSRPKCLETAVLESSQVMLVLCGSGGPEDLVVWVSVNLAGMPTTGPPTDLAWQLDWGGGFVLGPWWLQAPHSLPVGSFLEPPCPTA